MYYSTMDIPIITIYKEFMFTECDDGTYGYNCVNNCRGHCLNKATCNEQTGHCDRGCIPCYTNKLCSESKYYDHFTCISKHFSLTS